MNLGVGMGLILGVVVIAIWARLCRLSNEETSLYWIVIACVLILIRRLCTVFAEYTADPAFGEVTMAVVPFMVSGCMFMAGLARYFEIRKAQRKGTLFEKESDC